MVSPLPALLPISIHALLVEDQQKRLETLTGRKRKREELDSKDVLSQNLDELRKRIKVLDDKNEGKLKVMEKFVRPVFDGAMFVASAAAVVAVEGGVVATGPFAFLIGAAGLTAAEMAITAISKSSDYVFDAAIDNFKEGAKRESDELLRAGLAQIAASERAELEKAIRNQDGKTQVKLLMDIPVVKEFMDSLNGNPRQQAIATNFLLEDFKSKKEHIIRGDRFEAPTTSPSQKNLKASAQIIDQSLTRSQEQDAVKRAQVAVVQDGLAVINTNLQSLKDDVRRGVAIGAASLDKISMLEELEKMRMTPQEKLALVNSGRLVVTPAEKEKLQSFCTMQQTLADAQKTMGNINGAANALAAWGIEIPKPLQTALALGNVAVSAFANFAAGNPVGAVFSVIGGLGNLFGPRRPDPVAQRHSQIMEAFSEVLRGQEVLRQGQEAIFDQGREILGRVCQLQEGQRELAEVMNKSMKLQLDIFEREMRALDCVREEVISGQRQLMEASMKIIEGQALIYDQTVEIRRDIIKIGKVISDVYLELSKQLTIIHRDVLYVITLQVEDLNREVLSWLSLAHGLLASNMWSPKKNRFVDYTAFVSWVETNQMTIANAFGEYNKVIPQLTPYPGERLNVRLSWRNYVPDEQTIDGKIIKGFRPSVYEPLGEFIGSIKDPRKWGYLLHPVKKASFFDERDETLMSLPPHPASELIQRQGFIGDLLYPPYMCRLVDFFPFLVQIRTVMRGERVIAKEDLLNPSCRLSDEAVNLLDRFYRLFDLAIAQQALIAGDVVIPYYWNQLFQNVGRSEIAEQDQRSLMRILYDKETPLSPELKRKVRDYQANYEQYSDEEKEALYEALDVPCTNGILAENLMRYIINRYLARNLMDYETCLIPSNPQPLQQALPGWTCIYSSKQKTWMGVVLMPEKTHYLCFTLPTPYSVKENQMTYPPFMDQLVRGQQVLGLAIGEVGLGKDQDYRAALMGLLKSQQGE